LLGRLGVEFEGARSPAYRVCLPDRELEIVSDTGRFERELARVFPGRERAKRAFWRFQEAVGAKMFRVAARGPRLPVRGVGDLAHDLRLLGAPGLAAAATWGVTAGQVLGMLGLGREREFRALVAMLLQDTAQAGPETVPFVVAATCLQAYRLGMSRPRGGMKALAEGIGGRFRELGGDLRTGTLVDRVEEDGGGGFVVVTRRRQRIAARQVVFNTPLDLATKLLGRPLEHAIGRAEKRSRAEWGAFTAYLAIDREAVPDEAPLFHQVLRDYDRPIHDGNNVLVSLSPLGDPGYGPEEVRVATLSTHVRPADWLGLSTEDHEEKKTEYAGRMLGALDRALPGASAALKHTEYGTPRAFNRYTRRTAGAVGGPPVRRGNSLFRAVGADALGTGLWLVGDSVFPGQGTMAVVLSAGRVVERITGRSGAEPRAVDGARRGG
jgi:phytoene dehydrogenase-like protein